MLKENMVVGLKVRRREAHVSPTTHYEEGEEKNIDFSNREAIIYKYSFSSDQKYDMEEHDNNVEHFCVIRDTQSGSLKYARCELLEPWSLTK